MGPVLASPGGRGTGDVFGNGRHVADCAGWYAELVEWKLARR